MRVSELIETVIPGNKLWHITEQAMAQMIMQTGAMIPKARMRGAQYSDARLHFFTTLNADAVNEIEALVRFGGIDFDDEDLVSQREGVPLVLMELNLPLLNEIDKRHNMNRVWNPDSGVTEGVGVWTSLLIPAQALTILKTL